MAGLNWRAKQHLEYSQRAAERALELMDLTGAQLSSVPRLKEVCRVRELFADDFFGENEYHSTEASWRADFDAFAPTPPVTIIDRRCEGTVARKAVRGCGGRCGRNGDDRAYRGATGTEWRGPQW